MKKSWSISLFFFLRWRYCSCACLCFPFRGCLQLSFTARLMCMWCIPAELRKISFKHTHKHPGDKKCRGETELQSLYKVQIALRNISLQTKYLFFLWCFFWMKLFLCCCVVVIKLCIEHFLFPLLQIHHHYFFNSNIFFIFFVNACLGHFLSCSNFFFSYLKVLNLFSFNILFTCWI